MFKSLVTAACLGLFALTASMTNVASAASVQYGAFVIHNTSNTAINYTVVWGDGDVEQFTIQGGSQRAHYTNLDGNGRLPTVTVVFDSIGGDDYFQAETYNLTAYAVNDPMAGKDYSFVYASNGINLDLYEG